MNAQENYYQDIFIFADMVHNIASVMVPGRPGEEETLFAQLDFSEEQLQAIQDASFVEGELQRRSQSRSRRPKPPTRPKISLKHLGPYRKIKHDDPLVLNREACSICMDEYVPNRYKRELPSCQHVFHKTCIDKWLTTATDMDCPLCRCPYPITG